MPVVKPPAPKHTTQDLGDRLIIMMPSLRSRYLIMLTGWFVLLWLFAESALGFMLIVGLFQRTDAPTMVLFVAVAAVLAGFGAFLIYSLAWHALGQEIIETTPSSIKFTRVVLGLKRQNEYLSEHISGVRSSCSSFNLDQPTLAWNQAFFSMKDQLGSIAFDYGARTFRFGAGIDEAEAKQIVAEIQQKFPQYRTGFSNS